MFYIDYMHWCAMIKIRRWECNINIMKVDQSISHFIRRNNNTWKNIHTFMVQNSQTYIKIYKNINYNFYIWNSYTIYINKICFDVKHIIIERMWTYFSVILQVVFCSIRMHTKSKLTNNEILFRRIKQNTNLYKRWYHI